MKAKYTCDRFQPIYRNDDDPQWELDPPAKVFAKRIARRLYGKRGIVSHVRTDNWAEDGSHTNFEAFIGVHVKGDSYAVSGHNVRFTVHREIV